MVTHVEDALRIIEERRVAAVAKKKAAREFYEECVCSEKALGASAAKRLAAAVAQLQIPADQLSTDATIAESMRKLEKRRYQVGLRWLRIFKRCEALSVDLRAGYLSMPGAEFEHLQEMNYTLGAEAQNLEDYRSSLEHDVRDLAKLSAIFRQQPKRLELALPSMDDVEPCDLTMFTAEAYELVGFPPPTDEETATWKRLLCTETENQTPQPAS